jgi:hypothetical protein
MVLTCRRERGELGLGEWHQGSLADVARHALGWSEHDANRAAAQSANPRNILFTSQIAVSYYFERNYEDAVQAATATIADYANYPQPYRWLAASLGQLGLTSEARAALDRAIAASPSNFDLHVRSRPRWFLPEQHEHLLDGLRKAGWHG